MRARELMTTPVVIVPLEANLKEVAERMVAHRVSGVPVVDHLGHWPVSKGSTSSWWRPRGRSSLKQLLYRRVAEAVVHASPSPVLTVRTDGAPARTAAAA